MKIRTDFVTNSSSYSSTSIVIDNPVLMEILVKYKEIGLFENLDLRFEIAPDSDRAFTYLDEDCIGPSGISSLQECLEEIIEIISSDLDDNLDNSNEYDENLFETMVKELRKNEDKILEAYKSVSWLIRESSNEEDYDGRLLTEDRFSFAPEKGEEVYYRQEDADNGNIIREEHRINGKDVE